MATGRGFKNFQNLQNLLQRTTFETSFVKISLKYQQWCQIGKGYCFHSWQIQHFEKNSLKVEQVLYIGFPSNGEL